MITYLCYGGWINPPNNTRTRIKSANIPKLYGIDPYLCFYEEPHHWGGRNGIEKGLDHSKYIVLTPRANGDYKEHFKALKLRHLLEN